MINKVILIGRVGKDPEIRHLENNTSVARFSLATSETYKNKNNEKITNTEWHNIVVWRGLSEIAERYVKKGMMLYVEGKLRNRSWDDKDGNKRYSIEIEAENFQMLGSKPENDTSPSSYGNYDKSANTGNYPPASTREPEHNSDSNNGLNNTDDLPF
jgi:single-strand DNA-binding protein